MRRTRERFQTPGSHPIVCAVFFAVFVLSPGVSFAQEKPGARTLNVGTLAPGGSTWMDVLKNILFMAEKKTDGRIKFSVHGGGVMGDEPDMVRKMRHDQLQEIVRSLEEYRRTRGRSAS